MLIFPFLFVGPGSHELRRYHGCHWRMPRNTRDWFLIIIQDAIYTSLWNNRDGRRLLKSQKKKNKLSPQREVTVIRLSSSSCLIKQQKSNVKSNKRSRLPPGAVTKGRKQHLGEGSRNFRALKLRRKSPRNNEPRLWWGQTILVVKFQKRKPYFRPKPLERR